MDMDYEIYHPKPLFDLMKRFDFIGVRGINLYYENGFMAAKPNHPILNKAIELEARNNGLSKSIKIPDAIKYPIDEYRRIFFSGPSLITVAYIAKNNIDDNSDILLPYWIAFNSHLAQYKNKKCEYSSKVTKEDFEQNNLNLEEIILSYTKNYKAEYSTEYREGKILSNYEQNIYYDPANYRNDFEIIGADMSCGTWSKESKGFDRKYYWKFPWKKNEK